jgi:catechol 2,3-dioxygenase-like lactoylglutathione lyase family enzyme
MLLDGVNHIALISNDVERLGRFYAEVFDAEVGDTHPHGQDGHETMTVIRIGPHTELNVFVIDGNTEADRQRLIAAGAGDGAVNDFGPAQSTFFRDPDGLEGEVLAPSADG